MAKVFFILASFYLISFSHCAELPPFDIDKGRITVSGVSSGACFATQFHVAYSSEISGSGTWAGVPYACWALFPQDYTNCMGIPGWVNVNALIRDTDNLAIDGKIDITANLAEDRVVIVHGKKDHVVFHKSSENMFDYWKHYIPDTSNILLLNEFDADHAVISDHVGTPCGDFNEDLFIENCDYNSVFEMLNFLLGGNLNPPNAPGTMEGRILSIDQEEFFDGDAGGVSMDSGGYVYIPPACEDRQSQCLLHIFFHGCSMYNDTLGTDFIEQAGFIEVADANNIVILFPQTIPTLPLNLYGCYDWYGYTNGLFDGLRTYCTKEGPQMDGCHKMMKRAIGEF